MDDEIRITQFMDGKMTEKEDFVVNEHMVNIHINGSHYASLTCLPQHLDELTVGYLYSERFIRSYGDVVSMETDAADNVFIVLRDPLSLASMGKRPSVTGFTGSGARSPLPGMETLPVIGSAFQISAEDIVTLASYFNQNSALFKKTGAVHSSMLVLQDGAHLFYEDIGRHNAVDKIIGKALIHDLRIEDGILLTSGRISSDMLIKTAGLGIPVFISVSAPTNKAVELAVKMNLTLIGFARGNRFNVYAGASRVLCDSPAC